MNTLTDKVNAVEITKEEIKNAIIDKGVSISSDVTFKQYADKIRSIPGKGNMFPLSFPTITDYLNSLNLSTAVDPIVKNDEVNLFGKFWGYIGYTVNRLGDKYTSYKYDGLNYSNGLGWQREFVVSGGYGRSRESGALDTLNPDLKSITFRHVKFNNKVKDSILVGDDLSRVNFNSSTFNAKDLHSFIVNLEDVIFEGFDITNIFASPLHSSSGSVNFIDIYAGTVYGKATTLNVTNLISDATDWNRIFGKQGYSTITFTNQDFTSKKMKITFAKDYKEDGKRKNGPFIDKQASITFTNCKGIGSVDPELYVNGINNKEGLVSLFNSLSNAPNEVSKIYMNSTISGTLTPEERLIATNKGWQLENY